VTDDENENDKPDKGDEKANVVRVDFKRAQRTSPSDPLAPQKFAVFSRFVSKGKVMVTLDARRTGVTVPAHLANEPQLNLDFSERFGLSDFVYDERGVRASLSFNRQPFFCDVPWASVYALFSHADNERLTWARSLPQEILAQLPEASVEHLERVLELQVERLLRNAREQRERELKPAPALDAAGTDDAEDEAPADGAPAPAEGEPKGPDDDDKPPRGPGGLRLVKG
jgi:stringent starvation protein B